MKNDESASLMRNDLHTAYHSSNRRLKKKNPFAFISINLQYNKGTRIGMVFACLSDSRLIRIN